MIDGINGAQIKKIYVTAKESGIDNALLHNILEQMMGKTSIKELTKYEAMDLIDKLAGKPERQQKGYRAFNYVKMIRHLEAELGWSDNPKRLQGFIRKYAKTDRLEWLTPSQASKIIEGLKKLLQKGYSENSQASCQRSEIIRGGINGNE